MINPLDKIYDKARVKPCRIVLAEGDDPRVIEGSARAVELGLAQIILLGNRSVIEAKAASIDVDVSALDIIDPSDTPLLKQFAAAYQELGKPRIFSDEEAMDAVRDPLRFSAMMVRSGEADGSVAGAVATTSDTVRAAMRIIGKADNVKVISSCFLMVLDKPHHERKGTIVFSDAGIAIDPSAEDLAEIAGAAADSYAQFTGDEPRVAMLSFSSMGSASHAVVRKVETATKILWKKRPDLVADGEMQFDAAFVPSVGASKVPNSPIKGDANVFVFPNLEAANIGYKIAQRIGGATAIGPILQGLAKPANDLSRGCSAQDVCDCIAITAVQSHAQRGLLRQ